VSGRTQALSLVTLLALIVGACSERPPGVPTSSRSIIQQQHLPNIRLTTHEGRSMLFYDDLVRDKVVAINFMFTSCRIACPVTTPKLVEVQKLLGERAGRDVTFLSITLDPEHDTPKVLDAYARAYGVGPGWYFLTGKQSDIEKLRRKLGVYDRDPVVDADRTKHAGILVLGNEPSGRWKAVATLSKPVRIRQAIERTILPPNQWPTGTSVVNEVPYEVKERIEPVDLSAVPLRD